MKACVAAWPPRLEPSGQRNMTTNVPWQILSTELDRWQTDGLTARLWLRDDDAVDVTGALERLFASTGKHSIPLLLAVIPKNATQALADLTNRALHVTWALHGYRHRNYAPAGEKSQELGAHRPVSQVLGELEAGYARLTSLCADRISPVLVPPWNRIAPEVAKGLPALGLSAVSTFGAADPACGISGLRTINTHLDIIDWKGTRGGRDHAWLVSELVRLLKVERESGGGRPVGILAHHLDHDDVAWDFLTGLFRQTHHPAARWLTVRELLCDI